MVRRGCVALLGAFPNTRLGIHVAAAECRWSTRETGDLAGLARACRHATVVSVLIDPGALDLPWKQALKAVQAIAPGARSIICHGIDDLDSQAEMTAAGAFYTLLLPADIRELRHLFARLAVESAVAA
jgi:DNA-binding NtrC family response regulator